MKLKIRFLIFSSEHEKKRTEMLTVVALFVFLKISVSELYLSFDRDSGVCRLNVHIYQGGVHVSGGATTVILRDRPTFLSWSKLLISLAQTLAVNGYC